jgi:peptide/nickel transport system substrate-binding protein
MTYDNKKGADGSLVVPDLAERPGTPSDGARTWTYQLQKGQRYEDGSEITAADVKHGVERSGHPELAAVEAPDAYTVVVRFQQPVADADQVMALPATAPVPAGEQLLSSGPYKVRSYVPGRSLDLVRNTFWDPKGSKAIGAYPDEVVAELGLSAAAIDQRIAESTGPDATAVTDKARVAPQYLDADRTFIGPDGSTAYTAMNTVRGPFQDIKVRQAFEVAYPLAAVRAAAGGAVVGSFATDVLPPSLTAHEDLDSYGLKANDFTGNPARAKQLLADAGYPTGVTVTAYAVPASAATAAALQAALAPAGFDLKVTTLAAAAYADRVGRPATQPDLVDVAWTPPWPSAAQVIPPLFSCSAITSRGNRNPSNHCDRGFDAQVELTLAVTDADDRDRMWKVLDKRLVDEAVVVPRYFGVTTWLYGKDVRNVRSALPFDGLVDLANVSVR